MNTTIQVKHERLEELKSCKLTERETYNEIIKRLIKNYKKGEK